jgi:hypothetical protein
VCTELVGGGKELFPPTLLRLSLPGGGGAACWGHHENILCCWLVRRPSVTAQRHMDRGGGGGVARDRVGVGESVCRQWLGLASGKMLC